MKLINCKTSQIIESIQNPFNKDCVEDITIRIARKTIFGNLRNKPFSACIEFIKDNTKGEHRLEDDNFETLLKRIESLVNNL